MEGFFVFTVVVVVLLTVTHAQTMPPGVVLPYAATNSAPPPAGYLLCDGAAYDQSAFPTLFAVIGTTYGGTATTFNVPDMRGRVAVGRATSGVFSSPVGAAVGSDSHSLTTPELAAHSHDGSTDIAGTHEHTSRTESMVHTHWTTMYDKTVRCSDGTGKWAGMSDVCGYGTAMGYVSTQVEETRHNHTILPAGAHSHTISTTSTGAGAAFSLVQPTLILNYIIKT